MTHFRVVLDTNVLVSALVLRSSHLEWLVQACSSGNLTTLVSDSTLSELAEVAQRTRFGVTSDGIAELFDAYLAWSETVEVSDSQEVPECRDPKDLPFLQLALVAGADALVTGDNDLLALASDFAILIITPADLRRMLQAGC